jgi:ABC-2 type transport system permease protein
MRLHSLLPYTDLVTLPNIGLVGPRSVSLEPLIRSQAHAAGRRANFHRLASRAAAARAVNGGTVAAVLLDGRRLLVKSSRSQAAVRIIQDAVAARAVAARLRGAGLSDTEVRSLLTPQPLPIDVLAPGARSVERNQGMLAVGLIALLTILLFYGQAVAQGVTEEKSSRVVELLLTTLSPRTLLTGKVLGIGLLGLAQLLLAGGAALVAGRLAGGAGLPPAAPATIALVVLWFVLGYAFYSVAFAAAGALVSRQEDLQSATTPITVALIVAFYLALIVANGNPNAPVAQIAAFLPPFAPMVVPTRVVLGDMNALGLIAAVVVDLTATAALIVLAGRIYERAILQIGAPVKLRLALVRRSARMQPVDGESTGDTTVKATDVKRSGLGSKHSGHTFSIDVALRVAAVALLIAGVAIGLHEPVAIVLMVLGLVLVVFLESHKRRSRGGAR